MAQVTIYLDKEHDSRLRQAAAEAGLSVSKWVALLIEEHTRMNWPDSVREAAGSWPDAADAESLRGHTGDDAPRESL